MSTFDFTAYIQSRLPKRPHTFQVHLLPGGYTNITARITFAEPILLSFDSHSHHTSTASTTVERKKYTSAILKYSPPHLASDPTQPLSVARQFVEARALDLIAGRTLTFPDDTDVLPAKPTVHTSAVLRDVVERYAPSIVIPTVIWHDRRDSVLWIEDLGDMASVSDALASCATAEGTSHSSRRRKQPAIEDLATQLGSFLAEFHRASRTVPRVLIDQFTRHSDTQAADIKRYLIGATLDSLKEVPSVDEEEREELIRRVATGFDEIQKPEDATVCLGLVDFWSGNILVSPDWKTCGLIDWEYFGVSDEASELGMFLAHIHTATFSPTVSGDGAKSLQNFALSMFSEYSRVCEPEVLEKESQRRFLVSYGGELVNGVGRHRYLDINTSQNVRRAGIRVLKAAGSDQDTMDVERLWEGDSPVDVIWLKDVFRVLGFFEKQQHTNRGGVVIESVVTFARL